MQLKAEQLSSHLSKDSLAPVYLISGDEPLLVQEAADNVRAAALQQGFSERELFHTETGFDWGQVLTEANSLSLFSSKKIIEIRSHKSKLDEKGSKILQEYLADTNPDTLLLIIMPKLEAATKRSKWVKTIEDAGVLTLIWPVTHKQLPRWISQRLQMAGIKANSQAIEVLADRVEGNLLAAVQEIEKLKLLAPEGHVDGKIMSSVVADSARYNVFNLVDKALEGDAQSASRTLRGLRDEGTEPTVILWSLTREIRTLLSAAEAHQAGQSIDSALSRAGVWQKRKPLLNGALRRLKPGTLQQMLRLAGGIDRAVKGMRDAQPWDDLSTLTLMLAGCNSLSPTNLKLSLQ